MTCLVVDLLIIAFLKTVFKRARPPHHKTDFRFVGPDVHSFPSGHATRCWAVLSTLFFLASHPPGFPPACMFQSEAHRHFFSNSRTEAGKKGIAQGGNRPDVALQCCRSDQRGLKFPSLALFCTGPAVNQALCLHPVPPPCCRVGGTRLSLSWYPLFLQAGLLYAWGVTMCLGRVALGRHYVTDVLAGAFLGFFVIAPISRAVHAQARGS